MLNACRELVLDAWRMRALEELTADFHEESFIDGV
jgi:hypothetical protein